MEASLIYGKTVLISDTQTDPFGRLTPASLLALAQEMATEHALSLGLGKPALDPLGLFWAIIRQKVAIYRLPRQGERITLETWPGLPTRTAFPRFVVAKDEKGEPLFQVAALWLFMNRESREMVLPKNSGVAVPGIRREGELDLPKGIAHRELQNRALRHVQYSELDCNGHLNNCKYANWMQDVLPPSYHQGHCLKELHVCYTHEALWNQGITVSWELVGNALQMEANREGEQYIFSLRASYEEES